MRVDTTSLLGVQMGTPTNSHSSVKPRLTVLMGAGGSFDLGVPLTDRLTDIIRAQFANPAPGFRNYFPYCQLRNGISAPR